jgi:bile acid-coenzyme A ligase
VIRDDDGAVLPAGAVGEIWVRPPGGPAFRYEGAEARVDGDLVSVGDLGWLDDDGYLYISDRRTDLIISGGANVYPAEVEGALLEHPAVADVAVVGLADPDWGQRVHAIIEPRAHAAPAPAEADLAAFCRARLAAYKVPKSFELVDALPRDPSGKLRRSALRDARR